ncbi:hypothetical protein [Xanthomonas tesorieronis]|uniref:hypothetical protein n=1 Tax=Xanthomonas tesorieronis TaxID=3160839 RepID=UPI003513840C
MPKAKTAPAAADVATTTVASEAPAVETNTAPAVAPEAPKENPKRKSFPVVTRKGAVVVTEFVDGTIHYNAVGAAK